LVEKMVKLTFVSSVTIDLGHRRWWCYCSSSLPFRISRKRGGRSVGKAKR
jgi:hypothetical protein